MCFSFSGSGILDASHFSQWCPSVSFIVFLFSSLLVFERRNTFKPEGFTCKIVPCTCRLWNSFSYYSKMPSKNKNLICVTFLCSPSTGNAEHWFKRLKVWFVWASASPSVTSPVLSHQLPLPFMLCVERHLCGRCFPSLNLARGLGQNPPSFVLLRRLRA